jgi:hypothetical protein
MIDFHPDVVMEYAFKRSKRKVNAIDFDRSFHNACVNGSKSSFLVKTIPLTPLLNESPAISTSAETIPIIDFIHQNAEGQHLIPDF